MRFGVEITPLDGKKLASDGVAFKLLHAMSVIFLHFLLKNWGMLVKWFEVEREGIMIVPHKRKMFSYRSGLRDMLASAH